MALVQRLLRRGSAIPQTNRFLVRSYQVLQSDWGNYVSRKNSRFLSSFSASDLGYGMGKLRGEERLLSFGQLDHLCSYGSVAARRHPRVESSPWRIHRRSLFLKASPEHASLQYLDTPDEGVVVISLNRTEARNAIGAEMLKQLHIIVGGMRHSTSARVLIVCSTVPGVFCAGADLKERRKMGISETEKFVSSLRSTFSALEALPIPTIAAVEGAALGGGLELALACDIRVCGDEALFGLPETSLAIIPGAGGTQRLPRVIGRSRAKELIFTARRIDAQHAEAIGLVDHCVQGGDAYNKALGIAREILAQGPLAVQVAKHAIDHGSEMDQAKGMLFEEACYSRLLNSRDRLEGLNAFAEKRKPVYHGE